MAKRRRTPPTPKLPDKVEHYYRACNETTSDGLENILAESRKTAKRAYNKHHLGTLDLWESEYGKRRRDAVRHTFPSIINHHGLTEKTKGFVTAAEVWSNLNQYTHHTLETLDEDDALLLAAALWFMDHADDTYELEQILSAVDWCEDWNLPYSIILVQSACSHATASDGNICYRLLWSAAKLRLATAATSPSEP